MNDSDLDRLLSRPLADMNDDGFSRIVLRKILARERRDGWIEMGAGLSAVAILAALVPAHVFQTPLETVGNTLANSSALAIGCAVLALAYSAYRLIEDRSSL